MKKRANSCVGLFAMAVAATSCGPNLTAVLPGPSTAPTTLAPLLVPQLEGVWGGEMTLSSVAGGTGPARTAGAAACGGNAFINVLGEANFNSLSITQDGRELEARLASAGTGLACTYTGQVGSNGTLALDADSCSSPLTLRCPNGDVVSLEFVGSTITATTDAPVRVSSLNNGRVAFTYNVEEVRDEGGPPNNFQGVVVHHSFTSLTRR
ncbi:MAG: hypothetical protein HOP16_03710 [Acidobacteria bacterium]|nr:hypothetical protein [Acidobacteriota bacterium]